MRRAALAPVVLLALAPWVLSGCSLFGGGGDASATSVFEVKPGMCFAAPGAVKAEISEVEELPCDEPHAQEAYARVAYTPPSGSADTFPGQDTLSGFADGACASRFKAYVGVDYLDSSLFFTYLLPSPRSWEQDDRDVLCLVTTNGGPLKGTVKGTKK